MRMLTLLTFELIFGDQYAYFEDFKLIIPDSTERIFSCKLSARAKKKYKMGRRSALWHIGDTLEFTLPPASHVQMDTSWAPFMN